MKKTILYLLFCLVALPSAFAGEDAKKKEKTKGKKIKVVYAEPADYIPEDLRREYKLGEFAELKTDK